MVDYFLNILAFGDYIIKIERLLVDFLIVGRYSNNIEIVRLVYISF